MSKKSGIRFLAYKTLLRDRFFVLTFNYRNENFLEKSFTNIYILMTIIFRIDM